MASTLRSLRPAGLPSPASRPDLRVVPARRRVAWAAMLLMILVACLMLGATYLHTLISAHLTRGVWVNRPAETGRTTLPVP